MGKLTLLPRECYGQPMSRECDHNSLSRACCALATIVVAAAGCASGERAQRESDVAALRAQIDELKKGQDANARELTRVAGEMKALDAQSAFLVGQTKTTTEELARIKTGLEDAGSSIRGLQGAVEDLGKRAASPPSAEKSPPLASPPDASPEQIFAAAMASFQAEELGQAVLGWNDVTKRFPTHPLASSAQYWIGEAYYRQRDFRQAMEEFRKVVDGYPKSPQVAESLLKIGLCHRALNDPARARGAWEQLAREYPTTSAATQARALLAAPAPTGRPAR